MRLREGSRLGLGAAALLFAACDGGTEPVTVTSVEVSSPIGTAFDLGGSAQLAATLKDAQVPA